MDIGKINFHIEQANLLQAAMQKANQSPDFTANVDLDGKGPVAMKGGDIAKEIDRHNQLAREAALPD